MHRLLPDSDAELLAEASRRFETAFPLDKAFLAFTAQSHGKTVADLGFADVGPETLLAFLDRLERSRHNSVRTRTAR